MILFFIASVLVSICFQTVYTAEEIVPCNKTVTVISGNVNATSANYPNPYPGNLNCWWTFRSRDINHQVIVTMVDSVINPSINCSDSSLSFYDGSNKNAKFINKYCGNSSSTIASTGDTMFVVFKSGTGPPERGFWLNVSQIPKCGGTLTLFHNETSPVPYYVTKSITSPNYPVHYYSNLNCIWNIQTEPGFVIAVEVEDSDIETSPGCRYDSVTVYNGNSTSESTEIGRFCANYKPSFESSKSQVQINFKTDLSGVSRGFKLKVTSKLGSYQCGFRTTAYNDLWNYIVSPGYPHSYYSNLDCVWIIKKQSESIELDVVASDIEDDPKCAKDFVTVSILDGIIELGTFCGTVSNSTFYTAKNEVKVVFKTNGHTERKGFKLRYKGYTGVGRTTTLAPPLPCGQRWFSVQKVMEKHVLSSPGYPSEYHRDENCIYTITAPPNTKVHMQIIDSEMEPSLWCEKDYVHVYEGNSTNGKSVTIWCGTQKPEFQSTTNQVTLHFVSNEDLNYKGFKLTYYATKQPYICHTDLVATTSASDVTSSNYPHFYQNNVNCTWTITTSEETVTLKVLEWDVEHSDNCTNDKITVYEEMDGARRILPGLDCNGGFSTAATAGKNIHIEFLTDNLVAGRGFKLQYRGANFTVCGDLVRRASHKETLYLESPNYPLEYPNDLWCAWTIEAESFLYRVVVQVEDSSLPKPRDDGCFDDFVEVFDGPDATNRKLGRFCGSQKPSYRSSGRYLTIKFSSDFKTSMKGFKIAYNAVRLGGILGIPVGR